MIVKVQSPIADPSAMWLVYNEGKTFIAVKHKGDIPEAVQVLVKKGGGKAYVDANVTGKTLVLGTVAVPNQTW